MNTLAGREKLFKRIKAVILVLLLVIAAKYAIGSNPTIETDFNKENVPLPESIYEKPDYTNCLDSIASVKNAIGNFIEDIWYWFSFYAEVGD